MSGPGGTINLTESDDQWPGVGDDNSGNEWINCFGGNDSIFGGLGADTVFGGNDNDDILGDEGSDQLFGGEGNDRLQGGGGADYISDIEGTLTQIDAGGGDDYVQIGGNFDIVNSVINGGTGFDILQSSNTRLDQYLYIDGFEGLETFGQTMYATATQFAGFRMIRSSGEDPGAGVSLGLAGEAGIGFFVNISKALEGRDCIFFGSWGDDSITSGSGNDVLWGDLGSDQLTGGAGKDSLHGSAGSDTLIGGNGRDVLTGGGGADRFVFSDVKQTRNENPDRIIDFGRGNDVIDLTGMGASVWGGEGGFNNIAGEVVFNKDLGDNATFVFIDTDGNGVTDARIILDGLIDLTAGMFDF